jgi:glyoxylase-like metal-dependent hydrolase (beta-lactamase superfamily II)
MQRRDLLLAGAALAAAPIPLAAQPAPQFHRMTVGTLPVTIVQDGVVLRDVTTQGAAVNATAEQVLAALAAAGTPGATQPVPFNQTVVRTRAGLVLLDTGFGQGAPAGMAQRAAVMRAAGIDPDQVAMVVISHFHPDHIGGLLAADGAPAFPNAAMKVPEIEWAYWTDEGEAARSPEGRRPLFAEARRRFAPYAARLERFAAGAEVAPGITAVATPGHTPGHVSFLIADGNAQALVIGDAVTSPALYMANPDWYPVFDMDPPKAVATRRALLDRAANERMPVIGYHFPFPATGLVERAGSGYRLVPAG